MARIDKNDILEFVGEKDFEKGSRYFSQGAIFGTKNYGTTIKAFCRGSQAFPYMVSAIFGKKGIEKTICSCPVGKSGRCKHVAALLLAWMNKPDDFRKTQGMESSLKERSSGELIQIIKQMVELHPELESMTEISPKRRKKQDTKKFVDFYASQASGAFEHIRSGWGFEADIAYRLDRLVDSGNDFVKQKEFSSAYSVFYGVAKEVLENYEMVSNEEGEIGEVVSNCVEGLEKCLAKSEDKDLREKIFRSFFEIYDFDVNYGGVGLSDNVPEIILKHASKDEKQIIAEWVRNAIQSRKSNKSDRDWYLQQLGSFLLELEKGSITDEKYLQVCRETGRLNNLVDKLLSLGRIEEAEESANDASDYGLIELADIFVKHKQGKIAENLMNKRAEKSNDNRIVEWLRNYYKTKNPALALLLSQKLFKENPEFSEYNELKSLAKKLEKWGDVSIKIYEELRLHNEYSLLAKIFLDEDNLDKAIDAANRIQETSRGWGENMLEKVAVAAEKKHQEASIGLYKKLIEDLFAEKGRENYQKAGAHLKRIRKLYADMNASEKWEKYFSTLMEKTHGWRAFKDEISKAGFANDY